MPMNSLQQACSPKCAIDVAKDNKKRAVRREQRKARARLKTLSQYMKEAQQAFNQYIRARDAHLPCISCGRFHEGQWHAGHYRTTAAAPELRFHELNCHKQCAPCNNHKSGDIVNYRKNLIARIGEDNVDWLEGPHEPKRYRSDDLIEIREHYKQKVKELREMKRSLDEPPF